mgnify:CR=1 FL=1
MQINATQIRVGMVLVIEDELYRVTWTMHRTPGKGNACMQTKLKNIVSGRNLEKRFLSSERVEKASLDEIKFNFLYEDESDYYFINQKSFEQINMKKNIIGEKGKMLSENLEVNISFYNDRPLMVDLPNQVTCKVDSTDVALKGQTVSSSYKPATLDNGINIQVPPFIESGDAIIVDTRTIEYVKKI